MKIDLHVHTKKNTDGESDDLVINKEKFQDIIVRAGVGIVAITNHYEFDLKQFDDFRDDGNYILLPGVELDITAESGKRVQANIIAHPNDSKDFAELVNSLNNKSNPIHYDKMLKLFDRKKWIIYLDYKSGKTSWSPDDMRKAIGDFKKAVVITDTNKATTLAVLNANNFTALIGSDVKDWEMYVFNSEKLLSTNFKIESYDKFWEVLKNDDYNTEGLFERISSKTFNNLKMENSTDDTKNDYTVNNITIKDGVNIFMGPKRTGKSMILRKIHEEAGRSVIYESSDKEKTIEELKKSIYNEELFSSLKQDFQNIVQNIISYKEEKFTKFHSFYKHINSATTIKFHNNWRILGSDIRSNPKLKQEIKLIEDTMAQLKSIDVNLEALSIAKADWVIVSKKIAKELWIKFKEIFKDHWKHNFKKSIKKGLDKLLQDNKGIVAKPTTVGLLARFNSVNNLKLNFDLLKEFESFHSKDIKEYKIPDREGVKSKQNIIFPDFFKHTNRDKFTSRKMKIDNICKLVEKFLSNWYTADIEEMIAEIKGFGNSKQLWEEEVVISDSTNNESFSNGEKAHMLLDEVLAQDVEYYILDEPGVFLSRESITDFLLPKISELVKSKKKVIIATHNSSLGINTVPINYIYRKYNKTDECDTYAGSFLEKQFKNIKDSTDRLDFADVIMGNFEGSEKHFEFRREIYEKN